MPLLALASSMPSRVSLVNLQKFTLKRVADELPSMKMLAPAQKMRGLRLVTTTALHLGMLEAQALQRVGQLDVDAEVVGVELQLVVVGPQAGVLLHVHRQRGDGPSKLSFQCLVLRGRGLEGNRGELSGLFHGLDSPSASRQPLATLEFG